MSEFLSNSTMQYRPNLQKPLAPGDSSPRASESLTNAGQELDLLACLNDAVESSQTFADLLAKIGKLAAREANCLGLWGLQHDEGEWTSVPILPNEAALWETIASSAHASCQHASQTGGVFGHELAELPNSTLVAGKLDLVDGSDQSGPMLLVGCFDRRGQTLLRHQWLLGLIIQSVNLWHQKNLRLQHQAKSQSVSDAFSLVEALNQSSTVSAAAKVLANHLQRLGRCRQVVLALGQSASDLKVEAVSGIEAVDRGSSSNETLLAACRQAVLLDREIEYRYAEDGDRDEHELALRQHCQQNDADGCLAIPLKNRDGDLLGSVLLLLDGDQQLAESHLEYLRQVVSMLSGHVSVVLRANAGLYDRIKKSWRPVRHLKTKRAVIATLILFAFLLALPLPFRVGCHCQIEPVQRRFVASPHEGILETTMVESGDLVKAGQIIARLDGRSLRIELAGLQAEYSGAKKRRESALAEGNIAQSQIAASEMQRHQASIDLVQQQLDNLEVQSPIDGIVVAGDLDKAHGAPVEMGQTLFEIAPLDKMLAEVAIPESEIRFVQPEMLVQFKLNAFPFQTWTGTIKCIHPSAEIIEQETVYIAEVEVENTDANLRPGMEGQAKISAGLGPLGWNLFHRPWESIRHWLVW